MEHQGEDRLLGTPPEGVKETPLGLLPQDWKFGILKRVAAISKKPRGLTLSDYDHVAFIPMELIPDKDERIRQYELRSGKEIRSGTYCEEGDILLAKITPSFENGKQGIVGEVPLGFAYATTEVYPLRTKIDQLDQMFLFYFFKLPIVRRDIAGKMEGSTGRQRVPKPVIENYLIPLPPLDEQRGIAAVLRAVQEAREATEEVIAATRELKRSLMRHLFTYGPVPVDQADRVALQETEIGPLPAHWKVSPLGKIATLQRGKDLPKRKRKPGPYPVMGANGVVGHHSEFVNDNSGVLVGRSGSVGQVTWVDGPHWPLNTALWVKDFHGNDQKFVYYFLESMDFTAFTSGVSVPTLNRNLVHPLKVGVPPLQEQYIIARILSAVDAKIAAEEARRAALEDLFASLLHNLMTGAIRTVPLPGVAP